MGAGTGISHSFFSSANAAGVHLESRCSTACFFLFNPSLEDWDQAMVASTCAGKHGSSPTLNKARPVSLLTMTANSIQGTRIEH